MLPGASCSAHAAMNQDRSLRCMHFAACGPCSRKSTRCPCGTASWTRFIHFLSHLKKAACSSGSRQKSVSDASDGIMRVVGAAVQL